MTSDLEIDDKYLYFEADDGYSYVHRRGDRVTWLDYAGGMWLIAGHEELICALKDDETFSSTHELPNGSSPYAGVMMPPTPIRAVPIELDPPIYQEYRRLLAPRFSPAEVRALRPVVADFADWCIDQHIESGEIDMFNDYIKLVPAMTTLHLLGLPVRHARIIADAVHNRGPDRFHINPAWLMMFEDTFASIKERRREPKHDLISYLLNAELGGKKLTDPQIYEIVFTIVIGGMSTTAKLGLGALSYLGVHVGERKRVIANPGLLPAAIEEFLRYYSPVAFLARTAVRDVCIAGQQIMKGDRVGFGFAAANRDGTAFDEPNEVCIDRQPNPHLAFGHGIHFCLGSGLGRAEGSVMIERVLERMPGYALSGSNQALEDLNAAIPKKARRVGWGRRVARGLTVTFPSGPRVGAGADLGFSKLD
jgi:cytochrome P450